MNILIFNVKYSPNLGDGMIAECLEAEISRLKGWHVVSSDLAGRTAWQQPRHSRLRWLALAVMQYLPASISEPLFESLMRRRISGRLAPVWRNELSGVDAVVIGGGQLLQDGDLNFPLKVSAAYDACRTASLPVGIFAVGVGSIKSLRGQSLFEPLLRSETLFHASVRDTDSQVNLLKRGCNAVICRDPGLLASRCWPASAPPKRNRPVVGLGIAHPMVLAHHSDGKNGTSLLDACNTYQQIISALLQAGFDVTCFTNGAGEDEECLTRLKASMLPLGPAAQNRVNFSPRATTPEHLARLIASFDAVVVHRLHAAIAAYSYGRQIIGLRWDRKLDAFFQSIAEADRVVDFTASNAPAIAQLVATSLANGHDPVTHQRVLSEAASGVASLVNDLHSISASRPRSAA